MSKTIAVVEPAGCKDSDKVESCVLHPNHCPYDYVNPLDLNVFVDHLACNNLGALPIGYCRVGDRRICAVSPEGCRATNSWVKPSLSNNQFDNKCTVLHDYNEDSSDGITKYIGCGKGGSDDDLSSFSVTSDNVICLASLSECNNIIGYNGGEMIDERITLGHHECDCSKTRTGACFRMGDTLDKNTFNYFCAVDKDVCDPDKGLTYLSVNEMMKYSDIDCRLCDAQTVATFQRSSKGSNLSTGAIVGIAIGSAAGACLLLIILHKLSSRKSTKKDTVASSSVSETENTSDDDKEDVKVHAGEPA